MIKTVLTKNSKEKITVLFYSLILLSLVLIGLDRLGWLNFLKRSIEKKANPIREKVHQFNSKRSNKIIPTSNLFELSTKAEFLERENANLKVDINELGQENKAMKKLLGAPLPPDWQFTAAKVLSVKNNIMTINQGSDVGVKKGQVVIFENVLIGQVVKVNPCLSKINLLNHKESNIKAKIGKFNIKGIVKLGQNSLLILDEVLQEKELAKDQIVVTSGEDEIFPPNLLIAKIESVEKNEAYVYQKAILKPFLNNQSLENVFLLHFN